MSWWMPGREYAFAEDASFEADRLAAVERAFDEQTRAAISESGACRDWRCWEVGAGLGSIAHWLGEVVGPGGRVIATDLDERWFASRGRANVEFRRHDVTRDPAPAEGLDLVHARFLLEHLADPPAVIARLAAALRPGGALVLEDSAGVQLDVEPPAAVFERLGPVWRRAGKSVGWDAFYGRALSRDMRAAGLAEIQGLEHRRLAPGGKPWQHLVSGLRRLAPRLVEHGAVERDVARAIEYLGDPAALITGPPVVTACARRPPDQ